MWPRKRIDIGWTDLAYGAFRCLWTGDFASRQKRLEDSLGGGDRILTCLSVRTGFDLLLQTLQLPPGSEVMMTAITIPDMIAIVERHGLVPVPVDLEFDTLSPSKEALERALTEKTRILVVAHLFGVVMPLEPLAEFARSHQLILIEDCAQSFHGWEGVQKSIADASLYSFGPIKTATSLGGALLCVRDVGWMGRLRALHAKYPRQKPRDYARRVFKFGLLKIASTRLLYRWILILLRFVHGDPDVFINALAKNFKKGDLLARIRQQPCGALITVMEYRRRTCDLSRVNQRSRVGRELADRLKEYVRVPGLRSDYHSHWVFPVVAPAHSSLVARMQREGFDATTKHNLTLLDAPSDAFDRDAPVLRELLANIVFLPIYPELNSNAIQRLVDTIASESEPARDAS